MKIKWFGHACFALTSKDGITVVTDPFNKGVGYKTPSISADIVTTSHDHFDHNCVDVIRGEYRHINRPGEFEEKGIKINGVSTYHDEDKGSQRGKNVIFIFDMDGKRICHCGDIGHKINQKHVEKIGRVDILMVPVGGTFTVDYNGAVYIMNVLNPAITIPMHYKTCVLDFPIDGVDKFLSAAGGGARVGKQEIDPDKTGQSKRVIVLDYE